MHHFRFFLLACISLIMACSTTRTVPPGPQDEEEGTHVILDTMTILPESADDISQVSYHAAEERTWDLLHTILDLSFDWQRSSVVGKATLTLSPLFYPQQELRLDAVDFAIKNVLVNGKVNSEFSYDSNEIVIPFPQPVARRDKVTIVIEYVATPNPNYADPGAAITSDQGLFFIDPLDTIPGLPRQIWTQGETTFNRKWFPTIDQPNERFTQEIILTVADTLMTLSNGALVSSTKLNGGMRRDHWKLDLPHAPYLAMVAVGQWDKVSDTWRGRPVEYYVDPGYGDDAREIFAHTPEMIDFFSDKLGFDFVWPKYSQVIVKEFVTGAMENTTAVTFGDFIQFHKEDILESGVNDYIVAHELFHHWFGDLVTIESWANLVLNEGFANYAEYLWHEYKYGRDRADVLRMSELSAYYDQAQYDAHPLIHYHYGDAGEMFDAHSYNKGGLVLHMLRDLVGDEAFYASLRLYLQQHAYNSVEADDLRLAFEDVTGKDLHWFFNQWFFGAGHPILQINHTYDESSRELAVTITQTQEENSFYRIFRLPVEIATYYEDGSHAIHKAWMEDKSETFTFPADEKPLAVVFDPRDILLAVVNQEIPEEEYETRLIRVPAITHRISAARVMEHISDRLVDSLLADSSPTMRGLGLQYLAEKSNVERLYTAFANEDNLDLRNYILEILTELDPAKARDVALRLIDSTDKTLVIYNALMAIGITDQNEALRYAKRYEDHPSPVLYVARVMLHADEWSGITFDFFTDPRAKEIPLDYIEEFASVFAIYLSSRDPDEQQRGLNLLRSGFFLEGPMPAYRRYYLVSGLAAAYHGIFNMTFKEKLREVIREMYEQEDNTYIRAVMEGSLEGILGE